MTFIQVHTTNYYWQYVIEVPGGYIFGNYFATLEEAKEAAKGNLNININ